ncbi:MAG: hypothetical protein M3Y64_03080 [Gemmatimonadota bacterium]|nr:hypothetical protein [Gemmatimonadota bacterium]
MQSTRDIFHCCYATARFVGVLSVATIATGIVGCSHASAKVPVSVTAPPPVVAPAIVAPITVNSWTMPPTVMTARYLIEVAAKLERDSAGRQLQEHVDTRALVSLQGRRDASGGLRANGLVDSFTVRGLERALSPSSQSDQANGVPLALVPSLPVVVSFDAVLDERTLRVTTRPPLANECDRPESGATNIVRELLVRIPKTLSAGARWRDSIVAYQCRLGIPITTRTRAEYVVDRAEKVRDRTELVVRRTADTQLDGNVRSTWRTLTITGTGRTDQTIRIDAETGILQRIDGDGTLTVRLNDSSRRDGSGMQEVRQTTHSRTVLR